MPDTEARKVEKLWLSTLALGQRITVSFSLIESCRTYVARVNNNESTEEKTPKQNKNNKNKQT